MKYKFLLIATLLFSSTSYSQVQISTDQIRDSSITTAKLADGSVTVAKMAAGVIANLGALDNNLCPPIGNSQILVKQGGGSWVCQSYTPGGGGAQVNHDALGNVLPDQHHVKTPFQTMTLAGSDLTLSDGGGTVTLPTGGGGSAPTQEDIEALGFALPHGNGSNCAAGQYPRGVNENGQVEGCSDDLVLTENQVDSFADDNGYLTAEAQELGVNQVFSGIPSVGEIAQSAAATDGSFEIIDWDASVSSDVDNWTDGDQNVSLTSLSIVSAHGCVAVTDSTIDGRNINYARIARYSSSGDEIDKWEGSTPYVRDDNDDYDSFKVCATVPITTLASGEYLRFEVHLLEGQQGTNPAPTDQIADASESFFKISKVNLFGSNVMLGSVPPSSSSSFFAQDTSNESDNMFMPQIATLANMTSREQAVFGTTPQFPRKALNESDSGAYENSVAGDEGRRKYDTTWVRGAGRKKFASAQNTYPGMLACGYSTAGDSQQYNSPYHTGNSDPSYTHELLVDKLGYYTDFGDPRLSAANDTTHQVYPAHFSSTLLKTTTNAPGIVPSSGTRTFNFSEGQDGLENDNAIIIYTPNSPSSTIADEAATSPITDGFTNACMYEIVSHNATSVTVERNKYGDGNAIACITSSGNFVSHPVGSKMFVVPEGQGSQKPRNWFMNTHPDGPEDADGNTYIEAYIRHMNRFEGLDANGDVANITFDCDAEDVSETFFPYNTYQGDFDQDGVEDDWIVGNVNKRREAIELGVHKKVETGGISSFVGKPTGTGGTKEPTLNGFNFFQIEHIATNGQKDNDQGQNFDDMTEEMHRAYLFGKAATHPWYNCLVSKHYSTAFPFGGAPTSNQALHTKYTIAWMTGNAFCTLNSGDQNSYIDAWFGMNAVNTSGVAIANTPTSQPTILAHKRWIGELDEGITNISGVDLDALTPVFSADYSTTTDVSNWSLGGNNITGTISHDATNGRLVFSGYDISFNRNSVHLRTPELITTTSDVGKDFVIRLVIGSNASGSVQYQAGNTVSQDQEIYIHKSSNTSITVSKRLNAADDDSGARRRLRLEPSRLEDPLVANPEFYVYSIEVFIGNNIDPSVYARSGENAVGICNGTKDSQTIDIPTGKSLKAVDLSAYTPNQQFDGISDGQVFDPANPLTLPSERCITLLRETG